MPEPHALARLTDQHRAKLKELEHTPVKPGYGPLIWDGGFIRGGGNSAAQVVNLLARRGAKRILLVGVDGTYGKHWHPEHSHPGAAHATQDTARRWCDHWRMIAPDLKARGIEVVNCSAKSSVDAFPIFSLMDALE